jgi:hypothetical protein
LNRVNAELYNWYERHNKANKLKKIQPSDQKIINSTPELQKQASPKIFKLNENNKRNKIKMEKKYFKSLFLLKLDNHFIS